MTFEDQELEDAWDAAERVVGEYQCLTCGEMLSLQNPIFDRAWHWFGCCQASQAN